MVTQIGMVCTSVQADNMLSPGSNKAWVPRSVRWFGHVCRMPDIKLPKKVLYGQVKGRGVVGRLENSGSMFCCLTPESEHYTSP